MNPLSLSWFLLLLATVAFGIALYFWLRNKPMEYRRKVMVGLAIGLWAMSTIFTLQRVSDPRYAEFTLTQNLPLHFCSLVQFMLIPAYWLRGHSKWLQSFRALLFYPGVVAAFMALLAPAQEYLDRPLFSMNTLFYFIHLGNVLLGIMLVVLGFHTPTIRGALGSMVTFFVIGMLVFPITLGIRHFIDPAANYYFSFDPAGSEVFELMWGLIPIPLVYQLPFLAMVIPVLLLQYGIYKLISNIAEKRRASRKINSTLLPQH